MGRRTRTARGGSRGTGDRPSALKLRCLIDERGMAAVLVGCGPRLSSQPSLVVSLLFLFSLSLAHSHRSCFSVFPLFSFPVSASDSIASPSPLAPPALTLVVCVCPLFCAAACARSGCERRVGPPTASTTTRNRNPARLSSSFTTTSFNSGDNSDGNSINYSARSLGAATCLCSAAVTSATVAVAVAALAGSGHRYRHGALEATADDRGACMEAGGAERAKEVNGGGRSRAANAYCQPATRV